MAQNINIDESQIKWVTISDKSNLPFWEKLKLKTPLYPLVFIGALATTAALTLGLRSCVKQDKITQQKMMRYRVLAQGFTFAVLYVGFLMGENLEKKE